MSLIKIKHFGEITNFDKLSVGDSFVLYFAASPDHSGKCPYVKISKKMAFDFYRNKSVSFSNRYEFAGVQKTKIEITTF